MPTHVREAVLIQVAAAALALLGAWAAPPPGITLLGWAAAQGALAAGLAAWRGSPAWWLAIHFAFVPLAVLAQRLALPPGAWLAAFAVVLLVFWRTDRSRVPLYLSNEPTADALTTLLPAAPCSVIDLGCGDGRLLAHLARARPDCQFTGIEHAPLTCLVARLRCRMLPNVSIHFRDFWRHPLQPYQVVYAFLSPTPMAALWAKAESECPPGAILISNSFAVPGIDAADTLAVADRRATQLLCYRPRN